MENILLVKGGKRLSGEYTLTAAKNAILPIMAASLISKGKTILHNCPHLYDIVSMGEMLESVGANVLFEGSDIIINSDEVLCADISQELASRFRSSIFMLGAMLSRCKYAKISKPGGCAIGSRGIDIHIDALKKLGAKIDENGEKTNFDGTNMHSGEVVLSFPSVGATENIIMACCTLEGKSTIYNAACEPEIEDLANYLNKCGAKILNAGTEIITIYGVNKLYSTQYIPISDRILAGTILSGVAITGGEVVLKNCNAEHIKSALQIYKKMGCKISVNGKKLYFSAPKRLKSARKIITSPFPGFPTDMQSLFLSLASVADGVTIIEENIFENRFKNISQLNLLGAKIEQYNNLAVIKGIENLQPEIVESYDLRGGAGLLIALLSISGTSTLTNVQHIDRGYDKIEDIFNSLGADIMRT